MNMSLKQSSLQAYPITEQTYQGVPNGMVYDRDKLYNFLLKTLETTDITIEFDNGSVVLTGIPEGYDFVLPGSIGTITTTGKVMIS